MDQFAARRGIGRRLILAIDAAPARTHGATPVRFDQAISVLSAFKRERVRYALVGSMAMAAQGLIRATQDLDFVVASDPDNVESIKRAS